MRYSRRVGNRKRINTSSCFVDALGSSSPLTLSSFSAVLKKAQDLVETEFKPSDNALGNARGSWYEWLIGLGGILHSASNPDSHLLVKLPNISSFDCAKLYVNHIFSLIADLRSKVQTASQVKLITSNPDFVIVKRPDDTKIPEISTMSERILDEIDNYYRDFEGKCEFDDIIGFAGVKLSVRPDRRLQLPHEGSLYKALYKHIQTRRWDLSAEGLRYYAMLGEAKKADRNALRTVATHSIVSVNEKPEAAVDKVFEVNNGQLLTETLTEITQ